MKVRRALYAGSFDPFTNGHLSIVEKAAELFDEVIIGIACNSDKKRCTSSIYNMKDAIRDQIDDLKIRNVIVVTIDGLIADYCKKQGVDYLIRGLRNTSDYLYEENIAKINNEINPNLQTIYFRADNDVISSSMVRELWRYGKNVSQYVPKEINKLL